jgi:hypothetical protein
MTILGYRKTDKYEAEYGRGKSRYGDYEVEYDKILIEGIELYAETPVIEGDEEFGEAFIIITNAVDKQAQELGIDLDLYNPLYL